MVPSLTSGAVKRILDGEQVPNPILQLEGYKKVPGQPGGNPSDRYRIIVSDGAYLSPFAMLGTQLNPMITNHELEKHTIVKVDKCLLNVLKDGRKIIILLGLTVLAPGAEVGEKIGNPENVVNAPSEPTNGPKIKEEPLESSNEARPAPLTSRNTSSFSSSSTNSFDIKPFDSNSASNIHPISSLTPYQNKWTIKARITSKSAIRHWSNSRGEGKLFSINLIDESGEIRATGFNDAVDKLYDLLEANKVYYISKATLKTANKNFTSIKNDYEMTFNNDTTVTPCEDNSSAIPMLQFDFVPIKQIENVEKDATIDVIGVCKSASDLQTVITRSTNKEVTKRELRIVDTNNTEVNLTLWGSDAEKFEASSNPVIAVKGVRVSDFNGRSLSVLTSSVVQINPDIKEAHVLKGWYDREGCNIESQSISGRGGGSMGMNTAWKTFADVRSENLGMGDKADFYCVKATVVLVRKENCMYMACPSEDCNKKVIDMNNGMYRCEKCNKEFDSFKWRLLLSVSIADFTENQWVTCFQEAAEAILGMSAQELGRLKETDEERFTEVLSNANFHSFVFKLRTKMETFNEENRLKTIVVSATPVDPISYGKKLLCDIKMM